MLGEVLGAGVDLIGGNIASNIARRATRKAGNYLDQGYGSAIDLANPQQQQSQKDYLSLSNRYGQGDFRMPDQQVYQPGTFNYDPNSVFQDPEYQAQLKAGSQALESGAAGKGMLFSGNTGHALTQFGSDLYANRSNDLYNRARGEFESNRDFGYNAANRAYDTNAANRQQDYQEGANLASYAPGALDTSLNLNLGRAQAKSDTELGVGGIRSDAYRAGGQKIGRGLTAVGNYAQKYISGLGAS